MATNDMAESSFAGFTQQLQFNGDFKRNNIAPEMEGLYHKLPAPMRQLLLAFALSASSEVRKDEKTALNKQRTAKLQKKE
eukprot:6037402-Ditylum_brightwellii.AAC.1